MAVQIGFLLFPGVQQLDLTGPYDVLAALPDTQVHLLWKEPGPINSSAGMLLQATTGFAACPPLDVLCVPGGAGVGALMEDPQVLDFLRQQATQVRYLTSVCTGSLVLGAAGLLQGKRATTHWAYHELLALLGAIPVHERVVRDGNLFTGGGITAGIDFALTLAAELFDPQTAQRVQLDLEYAPAPPFDAGSPDTAPATLVQQARQATTASLNKRREITLRAAARLQAG
ncbi:isonitrile hydratase [Pseudomonas piscis]|uniref:DJ-1/PfpI family protein n=1 Tax=Pseudomonas piscis TaxID=2614538 RepID=A0A7X1U898_9PSED|nr:isonitrile hydratase [Pseudomonas piscis]MQA57913.1 DJ-1/PfpI family protein [Pseudomonas piscis]